MVTLLKERFQSQEYETYDALNSYVLLGKVDEAPTFDQGTALGGGQVDLGACLKSSTFTPPWEACAAHDMLVTAYSAGFMDTSPVGGDSEVWRNAGATIYPEVYANQKRGMNVVVMSGSTGEVTSVGWFDTYGDSTASSRFVGVLLAANTFDFVAVVANDEATGQLSEQAKAGAESLLGAQKIRNIPFRSSYVLMAIKGKGPVAEMTSDTEGLISSYCLALNNTVTTEPTKSCTGTDIVILSGGFYDGNDAAIPIAGYPLTFSAGRGFSAAVFRATDSALLDMLTFDTYTNVSDSEALYRLLLRTSPEGSVLALAVRDEATWSLNSKVRTALKEKFGAVAVTTLAYRGSYALVSANGVAAAETTTAAHAGGVFMRACLKSTYLNITTNNLLVPPSPVSYSVCNPWPLVVLRTLSGANLDGNTGSITANGLRKFDKAGPGLNVVVFATNDQALPSVTASFDTSNRANASALLMQYLNETAATGDYIAIVCVKECSLQVTPALSEYFRTRLGAAMFGELGYKYSYSIITKMGASSAIAEDLKKPYAGPVVLETCIKPSTSTSSSSDTVNSETKESTSSEASRTWATSAVYVKVGIAVASATIVAGIVAQRYRMIRRKNSDSFTNPNLV
jgi:hypothetical protein